jgi:hypothetical protein
MKMTINFAYFINDLRTMLDTLKVEVWLPKGRFVHRWILGRSARFWILLGLSVHLQGISAEGLEEYTVKSALTYNLAIFTEWPEHTFKDSENAMHICVIGDNIVQDAFQNLNSKKVGDHPIKLFDITRSKNIQDCHIVFIGNQDRIVLSQIQNYAASKPILTIDDIDGLSTYKGIVNLQEIDGKVQLNVNLKLASEAKLKISARLLKLANIVSTNP